MIICIENLNTAEMDTESEIISEFGRWLKEKREAQRLSVRQLERLAHKVCSASFISQLENNNYVGKKGKPMQPDIQIVEGLATALGASVEEAREKAGYPPRDFENPREQILSDFAYTLSQYPELSEESQEFIKRQTAQTVAYLHKLEKQPNKERGWSDLPELLEPEQMPRDQMSKLLPAKKKKPSK